MWIPEEDCNAKHYQWARCKPHQSSYHALSVPAFPLLLSWAEWLAELWWRSQQPSWGTPHIHTCGLMRCWQPLSTRWEWMGIKIRVKYCKDKMSIIFVGQLKNGKIIYVSNGDQSVLTKRCDQSSSLSSSLFFKFILMLIIDWELWHVQTTRRADLIIMEKIKCQPFVVFGSQYLH